MEAAFIERARARFATLYPDLQNNGDYTTIVSDRHFARLQQLASDAQAAGAQLHALSDAASDPASRRFVPCALTHVPASAQVMHEEIFGPLLPLVPYERLDEAIAYVNARPRPLALYLFDEDASTIERVMHETISGGVTVNETLMHIACSSLPFGGVGASGMGAYHGYDGFVTFSKMKPVVMQPRINLRGLIAPPYGKRFAAVIKLMLKF
ncbi:Coniferyl aldehyde dehydrogenase [Burkholderia multivorans]|nr:Coniferyl aldehyde dehydrogenase [Burkholderia multivorans]